MIPRTALPSAAAGRARPVQRWVGDLARAARRAVRNLDTGCDAYREAVYGLPPRQPWASSPADGRRASR